MRTAKGADHGTISSGPFAGLGRQAYGVLCVDPPFHYLTRSDRGQGRSPSRHYTTMTLADIAALPVCELSAPSCALFLWVPGPHLPFGLALMQAWGFAYSGLGFVWIKLKKSHDGAAIFKLTDLHLGMGFTTRKNAELCLLARRGQPKRQAADVRDVIISPRREHSRKPDEALERMERLYPGPYCEIFARGQGRPGWTVWGEEAEAKPAAEAAEAAEATEARAA